MHIPRNLIVIVFAVFPAFFAAGSAPAQSDAPLRLIGTIEGGDFSGAVFDDAGGQKFYRLREQMPDGSQIIKIMDDSILIRRSDGSSYELFIARGTKSSPLQPVSAGRAASPVNPAPTFPAPAAPVPPPDMPAGQQPPEVAQPAGREERNLQPGSEPAPGSPRRRIRRHGLEEE